MLLMYLIIDCPIKLVVLEASLHLIGRPHDSYDSCPANLSQLPCQTANRSTRTANHKCFTCNIHNPSLGWVNGTSCLWCIILAAQPHGAQKADSRVGGGK